MALEPGTQLGSYEITGRLGAGGMGEVYRALDTKLEREVAIKTLPAGLAGDADRLARFEREAKLLASLNHAHIASVYGLDEHEGALYIAMELVEGETLEEKLKSGAIPVEEALRLALQIAEALVLGTAGYMSPEQASGQATDQRADIWAFGVVRYEMLTGLPLFCGESVPDILADVLRAEPDWGRLPKNLHPRIREALERCLEMSSRRLCRRTDPDLLIVVGIKLGVGSHPYSGARSPVCFSSRSEGFHEWYVLLSRTRLEVSDS